MTVTQKLMLQFCNKNSIEKDSRLYKLIVQKSYKFIVYKSFFIALGILGNFLRKINIEKSLVLSGTYERSFNTSPPQKSLSLHCKHINRVKNEVAVQSRCLLAYMQFSAGKTTFNLRHLLPLQLDTYFWHFRF